VIANAPAPGGAITVDRVVRLAAVEVVTVCTSPLNAPEIVPIKPLVDVTGPEKVVELIINSSHAS
jgi:hypothetical protein